MSCATLPIEILEPRPYVHIWMTPDEAAEILDVTVGVVEQKVRSGELASRSVEDGTTEVLICLPERPAVPVNAAMAPSTDVWDEVERRLAPPPIPATIPLPRRTAAAPQPGSQWIRSGDVMRARRWARFAWAVVVLVIGGAAAGGTILWQRMVDSQLQAQGMLGAVHRMSATNVSLAAERMQLDSELAEARQAIATTREQLAVERNIEDTLLKAAIRNHGVAEAGTTFADGGQ